MAQHYSNPEQAAPKRRCQQPGCDRDATRILHVKQAFQGQWLARIVLCMTCTPNWNVYEREEVL